MGIVILSFDSLHGILRKLYDEMTELCQPMMTLATAIAAPGRALLHRHRGGSPSSRAEPVDVFGMLRPFCLGICILFFDVIVLGSLNGILGPVVQGTGAMLHDQTFDVRKFQEEKDRLLSEMPLKVAVTGEFNPTDEELEKEIADMGWSRGGLRGDAADVLHLLLLLPARHRADHHAQGDGVPFPCRLAGGGHDPHLLSHRPLRSGTPRFRGIGLRRFQGTLVQWLARYISVYLWLPISDLLGAMLAKIQTLVLQSEMEMIRDPLSALSRTGRQPSTWCSCS